MFILSFVSGEKKISVRLNELSGPLTHRWKHTPIGKTSFILYNELFRYLGHPHMSGNYNIENYVITCLTSPGNGIPQICSIHVHTGKSHVQISEGVSYRW